MRPPSAKAQSQSTKQKMNMILESLKNISVFSVCIIVGLSDRRTSGLIQPQHPLQIQRVVSGWTATMGQQQQSRILLSTTTITD